MVTEARKLSMKKYRESHKEDLAAKQLAYRRKNKELINKANVKYRSTRRAQYNQYGLKRMREIRKFLQELKENTPCKDCGAYYPYYVMDFDHVQGEKTMGMAKASLSTWNRTRREITKCEIVCSNCHRIRTFNRRNENERK